MKKNNNKAYRKMWLLLAAMVASAVVASLGFTALIYAVTPLLASLLIAGGALVSLVTWMTLAVYTLERAYEPGRPTRLPVAAVQRDLNPARS